MIQMTIFDEIIYKKANELLRILNEDSKKNEIFYPQYMATHGKYTILIASTKNREIVGNIIDDLGNIPYGFCVNWRSLEIIKKEISKLK